MPQKLSQVRDFIAAEQVNILEFYILNTTYSF
jgi:CO dehydrogenase/acetyl-CoA synthase epsilon subunit